MMKGFKIRLYPTRDQEELLWIHIGASRFIYNYLVEVQTNRLLKGDKLLSCFDMQKLLKTIKVDFEWLYKVSNKTLEYICLDVYNAFKRFLTGISGYPKFKSKKHSKNRFPTRPDRVIFNGCFVSLEKLGKIKCSKSDYDFDIYSKKICNSRISYECGKWILSFTVNVENQDNKLNDFSMGIDLGIKNLAVVAYDDNSLVFKNINKSHKVRYVGRRIKILQRKISRKYEKNKCGKNYIKTHNIEKCENELRKLHYRLSNIRKDYIHKTTHKLVSLLPKRVVMETLNVRGMVKNKHLSKSVQDQCFNEFIRQMKYKCEFNGIEFIQANRFYPSSKLCSCCGTLKTNLKLSDRVYVCDECGSVLDRDLNAAINLMCYDD